MIQTNGSFRALFFFCDDDDTRFSVVVVVVFQKARFRFTTHTRRRRLLENEASFFSLFCVTSPPCLGFEHFFYTLNTQLS